MVKNNKYGLAITPYALPPGMYPETIFIASPVLYLSTVRNTNSTK